MSADRRRPHRALYSAIAVGIIAVALIAVLATRSVPPGTNAATSLAGKVAPNISGPTILGDHREDLSAMHGHYVFLDFFASWCGPCLAEAPALESFLFAHRSKADVSLLGIDIDDSAADASAFLQRTGATWPAIEDSDDVIAQHYGVSDPPEVFLIDPSGRVVTRHIGQISAATLDGLLAAAQKTAT